MCAFVYLLVSDIRKHTKSTGKSLRSSPTCRRHAAVPSASKGNVCETYATTWTSEKLKPYTLHGVGETFWSLEKLNIWSSVPSVWKFPSNNCVAFCPKVRAELRGEGARTDEGHQDANQRERKRVLWHGSISAKEKRVGTTGHIHSHTRQWKKKSDSVLRLLLLLCL